MLTILLIFILGSVDFLMAMYQWNAAGKAVQVGARIAAVSTPVANGLTAITGLEGGANPGDFPPPAFTTRTCTGAGGGSCTGGGTYNAAAMNRIVFGRVGGSVLRRCDFSLRDRDVRRFFPRHTRQRGGFVYI